MVGTSVGTDSLLAWSYSVVVEERGTVSIKTVLEFCVMMNFMLHRFSVQGRNLSTRSRC